MRSESEPFNFVAFELKRRNVWRINRIQLLSTQLLTYRHKAFQFKNYAVCFWFQKLIQMLGILTMFMRKFSLSGTANLSINSFSIANFMSISTY